MSGGVEGHAKAFKDTGTLGPIVEATAMDAQHVLVRAGIKPGPLKIINNPRNDNGNTVTGGVKGGE